MIDALLEVGRLALLVVLWLNAIVLALQVTLGVLSLVTGLIVGVLEWLGGAAGVRDAKAKAQVTETANESGGGAGN